MTTKQQQEISDVSTSGATIPNRKAARSYIASVKQLIEDSPANSQPSVLPKIIFPDQLCAYLGITKTTLYAYTGNREKWGHLLPAWRKFKGSDRLYWYESDVLEFMQSNQNSVAPLKRKKGRPTKAEQLRKAVSK